MQLTVFLPSKLHDFWFFLMINFAKILKNQCLTT